MQKSFSIFAFVLFLLFFASESFGQKVFFNEHPTIWKNADILIWSVDKDPAIDPKEFCLSLKRNNSGIG